MTKNIFYILILPFVFLSFCFAQDGYFPEDKPAVNSLELLPPPPKVGSNDINFKLDSDISYDYISNIDFITGKKLDPEILKQAEADRQKTPEYIVDSFIKPLKDISDDDRKEIVNQTVEIIGKVSEDARNSTNSAKDKYDRERPCEYLNDKIPDAINKCSKIDLETGSYPSGHATRGMVAAYTLIEILPSKYRKALISRATEFGDSRVILGVHWQSDIDASYRLALAVFQKLRNNKDFIKDTSTAQKNLAHIFQKS